MTSTSTAQPLIAIIGGGPAGLVLLLTLHRRGIPATLYERESGFSSRSHLGGTLDLGYLSGQRALRENRLEEAFKEAFQARRRGAQGVREGRERPPLPLGE